MTDLAQAILDDVTRQLEAGLGQIADGVTEQIRGRAPVDEGELRDSIDWRPASGLAFEVFAAADHAIPLDTGTRPHEIIATKSHGILADPTTGFFAGGSPSNPARVQHPGSTKHRGWWTDAPWERWLDDEIDRVIS